MYLCYQAVCPHIDAVMPNGWGVGLTKSVRVIGHLQRSQRDTDFNSFIYLRAGLKAYAPRLTNEYFKMAHTTFTFRNITLVRLRKSCMHTYRYWSSWPINFTTTKCIICIGATLYVTMVTCHHHFLPRDAMHPRY